MTPETRAKLSAAARRRWAEPATRERMVASIRAATKPPTPEQRARIAQTLRGRPTARRGGTLTAEHRANIVAAWAKPESKLRNVPVKGECVYCGGPATERDHAIPRGRPGWEDPANVVLACHRCNTAKGPRTPDEWLADGLDAWINSPSRK